jgi:hypothetical protein
MCEKGEATFGVTVCVKPVNAVVVPTPSRELKIQCVRLREIALCESNGLEQLGLPDRISKSGCV